MSAVEIRDALTLSVDAEGLRELGISSYEIVDDGRDGDTLRIRDDTIDGYPVVEVLLIASADARAEFDPQEFAMRVGDCFSYRFRCANDSDEDPWVFYDDSGYTQVG